MWQKVRQVLRVVIVVLMDVSQEVKGPFAEVNTRQFATSHHRIHDSRFFRCIVVSTEHIVLSANGKWTDAVFYEVIQKLG